jgi:hypothetical protein
MDETWKSDLDRWLSHFLGAFRHKARVRMCPVSVAGLIDAGDRKSVQPMVARDGNRILVHVQSDVNDRLFYNASPMHEARHRSSGATLVSLHTARRVTPISGEHLV